MARVVPCFPGIFLINESGHTTTRQRPVIGEWMCGYSAQNQSFGDEELPIRQTSLPDVRRGVVRTNTAHIPYKVEAVGLCNP